MTTKITPPAGAGMTPGYFDQSGLWTPVPKPATPPPPPEAVAAYGARIRLATRRGPDAPPPLQVVTVAPGVTVLRTEPLPVATPPADLAERLEEFDESMRLERELAALGGRSAP